MYIRTFLGYLWHNYEPRRKRPWNALATSQPHKSEREIIDGDVFCLPLKTADVDAKLELNIEAAYLRNQ